MSDRPTKQRLSSQIIFHSSTHQSIHLLFHFYHSSVFFILSSRIFFPLSPPLPPASPPLPSPPFRSWRGWWRGGAASAVLFLRTVLLARNTDGYYGAAHKLIMLEINCCCQRQPPTCPTVSLCPLMHRIQLMDQMLAQCAPPFKVSAEVVR